MKRRVQTRRRRGGSLRSALDWAKGKLDSAMEFIGKKTRRAGQFVAETSRHAYSRTIAPLIVNFRLTLLKSVPGLSRFLHDGVDSNVMYDHLESTLDQCQNLDHDRREAAARIAAPMLAILGNRPDAEELAARAQELVDSAPQDQRATATSEELIYLIAGTDTADGTPRGRGIKANIISGAFLFALFLCDTLICLIIHAPLKALDACIKGGAMAGIASASYGGIHTAPMASYVGCLVFGPVFGIYHLFKCMQATLLNISSISKLRR